MQSAPRALFGALLSLALLAGPAGVRAADPPARTIQVNGRAEIKIVPNQVFISLGVQTWKQDLAEAKAFTDTRVKTILDLARKYEVAPEDIQTDYIQIEPQTREISRDEKLDGYLVRKDMAVLLRDTSKFERFLSDLVEAGVDRVQGVEFRSSQLRERRAEARLLALDAARAKAQDMAAQLGERIGRPVEIREETVSPWNAALMVSNIGVGESGAGVGESVAFGRITIVASVSVTFELIPPGAP